MYYKERTEFGTLSFSRLSAVCDDLLDELHRSAEIDRREPVRPAASQRRPGEAAIVGKVRCHVVDWSLVAASGGESEKV